MLKLSTKIGLPKKSKTYKEFLVFDLAEGEALLKKCKQKSNGVFLFLWKLIEMRKKKIYTDARLIHALSSALEKIGYDNVLPGELFETMNCIYADSRENRRFKKAFINSTAKITYANRHLQIDRYIKRSLPKGEKVRYLDIGCCPGENGAVTTEDTQRLLPNAEITAIDINFPKKFKPMIKKIKYIKADVTKIAFRSSYYDVIRFVNLELFLNMKARKLVRSKLVKALKPNGYLICGREARGYKIYKKV